MSEKTYNGWTNYETWAVALWLDNEEGSQTYCAERAEELLKSASTAMGFTKAERATIDFARELKEQHEEALPELTGFAADLLNAAMSEVNWHEIAENYVKVATEEAKEVSA